MYRQSDGGPIRRRIEQDVGHVKVSAWQGCTGLVFGDPLARPTIEVARAGIGRSIGVAIAHSVGLTWAQPGYWREEIPAIRTSGGALGRGGLCSIPVLKIQLQAGSRFTIFGDPTKDARNGVRGGAGRW